MKALARSEVAYEHILSRIVSFELLPGTPIIEDTLCDAIGISRTPLREALRRLEAEGLIVKVRNRGTFVRSFTHDDIVEVCEIRKVFELYSLECCMDGELPREELLALKERLESLNEASPNDEFYLTGKALHSLILRFCVNSRIISYSKTIATQLDMIRRISAKTPNRLSNSKQEHLDIVVAMLKGDKSTALQLFKQHLDNEKSSTLNTFQSLRMAMQGGTF